MQASEWGRSMLRRWTRFTITHASPVIAACLLLTAALGYYAIANLGVTTDTEDMIEEHLPWRQDFIHFRTEFPQNYRTIVVVVSAETEALADLGTGHLRKSLHGLPGLFEDIYSPSGDEPIAGRELLYLDPDDLEQLGDNIAEAQPFLGRLREQFALPTLLTLLADAIEHDDAAAATPFVGRIAQSVDASVTGGASQLDWSRFAEESDDGTTARRIIIVKPFLDFSRPRPASAALEQLVALGAQTEQAFERRLTVRLTGTIALEDEELVSVTNNAKLTGSVALLSVIIILYAAFRSFRLLLSGIVTLLAGLIGTSAFAAWSVGSVNVISVAFAVLYIGLGIDFVIHYLLRVRELAGAGVSLPEALETASANVGGSLVICAVTTSAGFYSFIPTSFVGVSQLGLISGTGMFISLAVTLTLLPAMIAVMFRESLPADRAAAEWSPGTRLSRLLAGNWSPLAIPVLIALISLTLAPQLRFESDPMLLRDPATQSVQAFRALSADSNSTLRAISVVAEPGTDVEYLKSRLATLSSVRRVTSLSSFNLKDVPDKQLLLEDISLMLGDSFHQFPDLDPTDVAANRTAIEEVLEGIARFADPVDPAYEDLQKALFSLRLRLDNAPAAARSHLLDRLQDELLGDLPRSMQLLESRLRGSVPDAAGFPASFIDRWQNQKGENLVIVVPRQDVSEPGNAEDFVSEVRSIAPHATGLPVVYLEAGETVIDAFTQAFLYALIAVTVILYFFLRSVLNSVLVLIPLALAAAITVGIAVLIDLPFNFANIIALPLLLGIGVDNGIHMVHRACEPGGRIEDLLGTSTSRAILFSALTTLASFGNLALSSHLGMASMGILLAIGLTVILLVMMVVLPLLLSRFKT